MTSDRRKRNLVNITVQRAITLRIASHSILFGWSVYLICVGVLYINGSAESGDSLAHFYAVSLTAIGVSAVAMLPAIIYDAIKFSNHMAGPVMRFRNLLPSIGVEKIDHIRLRKDDYWQDFAMELNAVIDRVEVMRQALAKVPASDDPTSANERRVALEAGLACPQSTVGCAR